MGIKLKITGGTEINLTDFSIVNYKKKTEDIGGKNEYLSRAILAIEIFGKYNVYDKSMECLDVNELSKWAKVTAHEKECYRNIDVTFQEVNDELYDEFKFEECFFLKFSEEFDNKKGNIDYYSFIRTFDDTELSVKI